MDKMMSDAKTVATWFKRVKQASSIGLKLIFNEVTDHFDLSRVITVTEPVIGLPPVNPVFSSKSLHEIAIFLKAYEMGVDNGEM